MKEISEELYNKLERLGIIPNQTRNHNIGGSNYAEHIVQPWAIWMDYNLNPWDADIVKRVLRTKEGESRKLDYEKIIHICQERIRQIDSENNNSPIYDLSEETVKEFSTLYDNYSKRKN